MKDYRLQERTISVLLAEKANRIPDAPYLYFDDDVFSYGRVEQLANAYAHGLTALGVTRGSRVALMMDNCPEYLWVTFALGKLGAVVVPINCSAKGQLLAYYLADAGCSAAVVDVAYLESFAQATVGLGLTAVVVRGEEDQALSGNRVLGDVLESGTSAQDRPPTTDVRFTDPWFIMFTSGTTGPSKGVLSPQAHPLTVGCSVADMFEITPADRMYTFLPMFHGNAIWYSSMVALWADAAIVLARRFSASNFWRDIQRYRCTEFNAIMTVATILEKLEPVAEELDNPLRLAFIVPLPVQREDLERRWGCDIVCNYSMTEILPAAVLKRGQGYGKGNTSGTPSPYVDMRIVDEDDCAVGVGVPGEVVIRPREPWTTFTEYVGKPEATVEAVRNLWFHTGDRAYLDEDGHFFFVDRIKDAIRRRGENISAHEIELVLETDPRIREAAAVPVPSEMGEDDVAVYVVRADDSLSEADVIAFAIDNLAYYMVPRYVAFIDQIPKTASHKKAKFSLREDAQRDFRGFWDREAHGIAVSRPGAARL